MLQHYKQPLSKTLSMNQHLAIDLQKARSDSGLTQVDCAHFLGIDRPRVSKFETGDYEPTVRELYALCVLFDKTLPQLYGEITEHVHLQFEQRLLNVPKEPLIWASRRRRVDTLASLRFRVQGLIKADHAG